MFEKIFGKIFGGKKSATPPSEPARSDKPTARDLWEKNAGRELNRKASPEELCGLRDGMDMDELRNVLSQLYRRHNRAASSLDPKLRSEAEVMLDAIVDCRQRYLEK